MPRPGCRDSEEPGPRCLGPRDASGTLADRAWVPRSREKRGPGAERLQKIPKRWRLRRLLTLPFASSVFREIHWLIWPETFSSAISTHSGWLTGFYFFLIFLSPFIASLTLLYGERCIRISTISFVVCLNFTGNSWMSYVRPLLTTLLLLCNLANCSLQKCHSETEF